MGMCHLLEQREQASSDFDSRMPPIHKKGAHSSCLRDLAEAVPADLKKCTRWIGAALHGQVPSADAFGAQGYGSHWDAARKLDMLMMVYNLVVDGSDVALVRLAADQWLENDMYGLLVLPRSAYGAVPSDCLTEHIQLQEDIDVAHDQPRRSSTYRWSEDIHDYQA